MGSEVHADMFYSIVCEKMRTELLIDSSAVQLNLFQTLTGFTTLNILTYYSSSQSVCSAYVIEQTNHTQNCLKICDNQQEKLKVGKGYT